MNTVAERKIDEDMVRYFVWSIWNFFSKTAQIDPEIEAPYLLTSFNHSDYTGVIGVSGSQQGAVYFTMSRDLLLDLYENHYAKSLGETLEAADEQELDILLADSAGEMANTVSGNVRNFLGENFLISTPVVIKSAGNQLSLPEECTGIILPIKWHNHVCHLVVGLRNNEQL